MSTTVKRPEMPHPEGAEKARTGIAAFITRHAVPAYYALAFAISWGGILLTLGPDGLFSTGATMPIAGGVALLAGPLHRRSPADGSSRWKVGPSPARVWTAAMAGRRSLVRGGAPDRPVRDGRDSVRLVPRLPGVPP